MTAELNMNNGGLQYVPQIAATQIVYLDFDGGVTSYNGEILSLDGVEVQKSGLSEERIAAIAAELNMRYASQNVVFVTDCPQTAGYSTVFIGKTEAFSSHGNFIGLAETIDEGNKITTDKAFVILDSTNSNDEIISTISHETDHLLGILDHGGMDLERFAHKRATLTGEVWETLVLSAHNCDSEKSLYNSAHNVTICSGGRLRVGQFSASNLTVSSGGKLEIGGTLNGYSGRITGVVSALGGQIVNYGADFDICANASFLYSSGHDDDGFLNTGNINVGSNALFSGCASSYTGGALYNAGSMTFGFGAKFIDNYGERGGAIYNDSGYMSFGSGAVFTGNSTWYSPGGGGQAVMNKKGTLILGGNALLQNNSGVAAGAIANYYSSAHLTVSNGARFINNSSYDGAGIYNEDGEIFLKDGIVFSGNYASGSGGAIYTDNGAQLGHQAVFSSNFAGDGGGGAISFTGSGAIGNSAYFAHNSTAEDNSFGNGGAIDLYGSLTVGSSALFSGNTAYRGGAVNAEGMISIGAGAAFVDNEAALYGGGMYIASHTAVTIGSNAVFSGNVAGAGGGIYADRYGGEQAINIGNNAVFSGNIATGVEHSWLTPQVEPGTGGAIYADRTDIILGNATFATVTDSVFCEYGTVTINGNVSFAGNVYVDNGSYDKGLLNNGNVDFNISVRTPDDGILLTDWQTVGGDGTYSVTVAETQRAGTYLLIADEDNLFNKAISLRCNSGSVGTLRLGSSVSRGNYTYSLQSSEVDGDNVVALKVTQTPGSKPDLIIRDYQVSTAVLSNNGSVKLTFKLANTTAAAAGASTLKVYVGNTLLRTFSMGSVAANGYRNCTVTLNGSELGSGSRNIYVVADANNQVAESNENNNQVCKTVTVNAASADLCIKDYEVSSTAIGKSGSVKLSFKYANTGTSTAGASVLKVYDGNTLLRTFNMGSVAAGSSRNATVTLKGSELGSGSRKIYLVVDAANQVSESNESNNKAYRTISVSAGTSDLCIKDYEVSSTSINKSGAVKLTFKYANNGTAAAAASTLKVYDGNTLLRTFSMGSVDAGSCRNATVTLNGSELGSGSRKIYLVADAANQVSESNESNNKAYRTVNVINGTPDLCIRDYEVSSTSISKSGSVKLTFKYANSGTAAAAASTLKVYDGNTLLRTFSMGVVAAGSYRDATVTLKGSEIGSGSRKIYLVVDAANQVSESNESNNKAYRTINVTAAKGSDAAATEWLAAGVADYNNDGFEDMLICDSANALAPDLDLTNGAIADLADGLGSSWEFGGVADWNNDGKLEVMFCGSESSLLPDTDASNKLLITLA